MEQRPLRLGDHVDDYCPRERRVTNHVIVAIVEDAIRQTRCTTCDAEHVYKEARGPRRRKKDTATLFEQVLADVSGAQLVPPRRDEPAPEPDTDADAVPLAAAPRGRPDAPSEDSEADVPDDASTGHDLWPGHRTLIRATLPKVEGELPPPRPIPEFTMHQRPVSRRGFGFRPGGQPNGNGPERNGNVAGGGEFRHGRAGQSNGQPPHRGNGAANGHGQGQGQGSGRRRRRSKHRPR